VAEELEAQAEDGVLESFDERADGGLIPAKASADQGGVVIDRHCSPLTPELPARARGGFTG
jgi:hypothetical protein